MEYEYEYQATADAQLAIGYMLLAFILSIPISGLIFWGVFKKGGYAGWLSMLPVANIYFLTKISGKRGYWAVLFFIPFINIVALIWVWNMISKSFGKDEAFTIGLVFLPFIFFPVLGYGSATYLGPYGNRELFEAMQGKTKFEFEEQTNP